jgi:enolase-phosphatase E1
VTVRSLLLDVEGTTTPIAFVTDVLFPFARKNAASFLASHGNEPDVRRDVALLQEERAKEPADSGAPAWPAASTDATDGTPALAYISWLMERDRKSTALKALQGRIWHAGYESGALVSPVYKDVPHTLARCREAGIDVSIFSSGSVLAQRLLFTHTDAGDLRPYLRAYFDTTTGGKKEAASYASIAAALSRDATEILFVSDVVEELDAARAAGMETALCVREGAPASSPRHRILRSLEEI